MTDDQRIVEVGRHAVRLATPSVPPAELPEDVEEDGRLYFWWGLTTGALALARVLADREDLPGKRVVELGCGLGLPGLVAGLGGAHVTFTDAKADALACVRRSAAANALAEAHTAFEVLDWERSVPGERFDLVLGAEILYDYNMHRAQLELLDGLVASGGMVLLADRRRRAVERFFGRLRDRGFGGTITEHELTPPGEPLQRITVYAWSREQALT